KVRSHGWRQFVEAMEQHALVSPQGSRPSGVNLGNLLEQTFTEDRTAGVHEFPFLYARMFSSIAKFSSVKHAIQAIGMNVECPALRYKESRNHAVLIFIIQDPHKQRNRVRAKAHARMNRVWNRGVGMRVGWKTRKKHSDLSSVLLEQLKDIAGISNQISTSTTRAIQPEMISEISFNSCIELLTSLNGTVFGCIFGSQKEIFFREDVGTAK
nr:importin-9 isoform X1 [Tanacetum cinerariifolium]